MRMRPPATSHNAVSAADAAVDLPALIKATVHGDGDAWIELVRRYARLVAFVIRHHRLSTADGQEVSRLVWLRMADHLGEIRDPSALPGWLAATTRRECERHLSGAPDVPETDEAAERSQIVRDGLDELAPRQRALLSTGSAGPARSRALAALRETDAIRAHLGRNGPPLRPLPDLSDSI
jgi:hypothetical protein